MPRKKKRVSPTLMFVSPICIVAIAGGYWAAHSINAQVVARKEAETKDKKAAQTAQAASPSKQHPKLTYKLPERFKGKSITRVEPRNGRKMVALTFDDGPWPKHTDDILNTLKKNDVRATFFVIGRQLKPFSKQSNRIVQEGHMLANHTWNHKYRLTPAQVVYEMDSTDKAIKEFTGVHSPYFRPPGGVMNNGLVARAKARGDVNVMWTVAVNDTAKNSTVDSIYNAAIRAGNGGIVLIHDGGGNRSKSVAALPRIISFFKKNGFEMVTMEELLLHSDPEGTKLKAQKAAKKAQQPAEAKPANKPKVPSPGSTGKPQPKVVPPTTATIESAAAGTL